MRRGLICDRLTWPGLSPRRPSGIGGSERHLIDLASQQVSRLAAFPRAIGPRAPVRSTSVGAGFAAHPDDRHLELRGALPRRAGPWAPGLTFFDPAIASKVVDLAARGRRARGPHDLTRREMRVLELLPKGLTNRDIAKELDVSRETVKTHIRHILWKLQVADRAEAAATAVREGLA